MTCSAPPDCAEIERRHSSGRGLLADGGASRGNLLSGEADHVILTVSRIDAEKHANPGYRAFLANGFNVMRALVLFGWEVVLEWTAASRAKRRDVRPRGHRGGKYPFLRAALCVVVRDVIVYGVLTDMMEGRPAVYATFSSYDEVAHHSGLERSDTLEALRKLDQQFGRIERARRYAPRPYELVVLSDHGQTQGATFKQRNGYGLDELVERSLEHGGVTEIAGGDEQSSMVGHAIGEATGQKPKKQAKNDVSDREVIVLGSGNLGLVYLMDERRRLTLEELNDRHPRLLSALRNHPHVGWLLVRSRKKGPCPRRRGSALPRLWPHRRNGSIGTFLAERSSTLAAHRRLRPRRRHHGRELLRPGYGRGLRVRGADLVPRRPRRSPDSTVSSLPGSALGRRRADCRRRGGQPPAQRLASPPEWRDSRRRRDTVAVGASGRTSADRSLSAARREDGDVLSAQQLGARAHPVAVIFGTTCLGLFLGRYVRHRAEHLREPLGVLQSALLGLVGLVLAFGLALAVGRYESRRAAVVDDANDIGTTYLRAQTLPEPIRTRSLRLLVRYTDTSIRLSQSVPMSDKARQTIVDGQELQRQLWGLAGQALAEAPIASAPRLYVETLNTMIDQQTVRVAALNNRVPGPVLAVEVIFAAAALGLLGFYLAILGRGVLPVLLAAALVCLLLVVTFDLDRPTRGLIKVPATPLTSLRASMELPPAAAAPPGP